MGYFIISLSSKIQNKMFNKDSYHVQATFPIIGTEAGLN